MAKKVQFKLIATACPLCGSVNPRDYTVIYPANFNSADLTPDTFSARRLPDLVHYRFVKCQHDGGVRANPRLSADSLNHLYGQSSVTYDSEINNLTKTYLSVLQPALSRLPKSSPILERGAGSGFVLKALAKRGYRHLSGIEPSRQAVNQADSAIRRLVKVKPFSPRLFSSSTFQLICFFQTLDHLSNPQLFLQTCYRWLKPGGYIVSVHHNLHSWPVKILGESSPIFDIEHTHLYDFKTTRALFEQQGFRIAKLFSVTNLVSLRHLCWLLPWPAKLKKRLLVNQPSVWQWFWDLSLSLQLGNIGLIAQKI